MYIYIYIHTVYYVAQPSTTPLFDGLLLDLFPIYPTGPPVMDLEAQDVDRSNLWFLTGISPPQKYHVFATSRKAIKKNSNKNVLFPKKNKIKNTPIFPMFPSQEKKPMFPQPCGYGSRLDT